VLRYLHKLRLARKAQAQGVGLVAQPDLDHNFDVDALAVWIGVTIQSGVGHPACAVAQVLLQARQLDRLMADLGNEGRNALLAHDLVPVHCRVQESNKSASNMAGVRENAAAVFAR